jgi:hypothetical protein
MEPQNHRWAFEGTERKPEAAIHVEHEEPVRRCAWDAMPMAQEYPPLGKRSRKHSGYLQLCQSASLFADGIFAMKQWPGQWYSARKIVLSDDPVAADATCARLMGFKPSRISHIREASRFQAR